MNKKVFPFLSSFSLVLLAGWLCTVQSGWPECSHSVVLTRGMKIKPFGRNSFVSP